MRQIERIEYLGATRDATNLLNDPCSLIYTRFMLYKDINKVRAPVFNISFESFDSFTTLFCLCHKEQFLIVFTVMFVFVYNVLIRSLYFISLYKGFLLFLIFKLQVYKAARVSSHTL